MNKIYIVDFYKNDLKQALITNLQKFFCKIGRDFL